MKAQSDRDLQQDLFTLIRECSMGQRSSGRLPRRGHCQRLGGNQLQGRMVDAAVYDNARTILSTTEEIAAFDKRRERAGSYS